MRLSYLLCFTLLFVSITVHSQERLKSKYFGTYAGKINSYKMETAGYLMDVAETKIKINLRAKDLTLTIGNSVNTGSYTILFEARDYFVLEAKMVGQTIPERIVVYKKGKKMSRDGLFPQPNAVLFMN